MFFNKEAMKYFLTFTFIFLNVMSSPISAQSKTIEESTNWGSGVYQDVVKINDLYFISTTSDEIDIIDKNLTGPSSLVQQFPLEGQGYGNKLIAFNNYLVSVSVHSVDIYSLDNANKPVLKYSKNIVSPFDPSLYINEDLYYADASGSIHKFSENNGVFSHSIVVTNNMLPENRYDDYIVIEGDKLLHLYQVYENGSYQTTLNTYDLKDGSLLETYTVLDNNSIDDIEYVGNGLFAVSNSSFIYLLELANGKLSVVDQWKSNLLAGNVRLTYFNDKLYALTYKSNLLSFSISQTKELVNREEKVLSGEFLKYSDYNYIQTLKAAGEELLVLSKYNGLISVSQDFTSVDYFYNQSGHMYRPALIDDLLYIPRESRIDILDSTDTEHMVKIGEITADTYGLFTTGSGNLLSISPDPSTPNITLKYNVLTNIEHMEKTSSVDIKRNHNYRLNSDEHFYVLHNDNQTVEMFNTSSPYLLNHDPKSILLPESVCVAQLVKIGTSLLVIDRYTCEDKKIYLLSNAGTDDFSFEKKISLDFDYREIAVNGDYIYFFSDRKIFVGYFHNNSIEIVKTIAHYFGPYVTKAAVNNNQLIISSYGSIHIFDITQAKSPVFISTNNKIKLSDNNSDVMQFKSEQLFVGNYLKGKVQFYKMNQPPNKKSSVIELNEDETSFELLKYSDPENDAVTISVLKEPNNGVYIVEDDTVIYTPLTNYFGPDSMTIKAMDVNGNFIKDQVSILVKPVNDLPIVTTLSYETLEDTILTEIFAITDIDSETYRVSLSEEAVNGSVEINDTGEFTYRPKTNYVGNDSFSILVTDSDLGEVKQTISIMILGVNDAPKFGTVEYLINEDEVLAIQLEATDTENDILTFDLIDKESVAGSLTVTSKGELTYIPESNYHGVEAFKIRVTDSGGVSSEQEFTLTVNPVDDMPEVDSLTLEVTHNGSVSGSFSTQDIDLEALDYSIINNTNNASFSLTSLGEYSYAPNSGFSGSDIITFNVTDGVNTLERNITFNVAPVPITPSNEKENSSGGSFGWMLLFGLIFLFRSNRYFK